VPLLAFRRVAMRLAGAAAVLFFVLPASAADPSKLIETVAAQVIDIVKTKSGADRQAAIRQVMQANFDLPFMTRSALGKYWNQTTEAQRARFLAALETAEARAYSERFGQYEGQTLALGKVTARPNGITVVDSKLNQATGQPIKLEWEVRDNGQGPRITDVKVEGVSLIMTRRSDFSSYIQNNGGSVEPLIQELEARASR
jgi:phospholipid transport system substrate-binding protein